MNMELYIILYYYHYPNSTQVTLNKFSYLPLKSVMVFLSGGNSENNVLLLLCNVGRKRIENQNGGWMLIVSFKGQQLQLISVSVSVIGATTTATTN